MLRRLGWVIVAAIIGSAVRHALWNDHEASVPGIQAVAQVAEPRASERFQARVVVVQDGDTVDVADASGRRHRIRFFGVDAPEIAHDGRPAQPGGVEASTWVSARISGRSVLVEIVDHDRWGREVGRVFVDGEDLNLALLQAGWGWAYRQYLREPFRAPYIAAEEAARREGRGIWSDPSPVAPWDWRHQ